MILVAAVLFFAVHYQAKSQTIKAGGGIVVRSQPKAGMVTKLTYDLGVLDPNLRLSLDFMVIPPIEANLDVHYTFLRNSSLEGYALAGTNLANPTGLNAGGGLNFDLSPSLDGFGEVKYLINPSPQPAIKLGILYHL